MTWTSTSVVCGREWTEDVGSTGAEGSGATFGSLPGLAVRGSCGRAGRGVVVGVRLGASVCGEWNGSDCRRRDGGGCRVAGPGVHWRWLLHCRRSVVGRESGNG